ncbi:GNAT family N-acetyltransferase [Puerhibacterium puerhi]|uniref:GNAT family N-acetyltransferase n=1 Tax=Puerhibacterium puerhi TaxID=2692623 RepID=UPI001F2BF035|nr:GNAT family N-acetyltransferase [Puerhibacterium puerhi]
MTAAPATETTWPVRTPRLALRPAGPADAEAFLAWRSQPLVVRYMYQDPWTPQAAQEKLARWAAAPFAGPGDVLVLAVVADDDAGTVVGELLLKWAEGAGQVEVGYAFHPDVAGRGYATEAARALLDLAFGRYGFHRAFARIDEQNTASVRVAQRLGMRLEARLVENDVRPADGVWSTELVYAMLAAEHGARRGVVSAGL